MPVAEPIATKFHGRKASACRRCGGVEHHVNRMGGIVCSACSPCRRPEDCRGLLTIEGGVWIDPEDRFSMVADAGTVGRISTSTAAAAATATTVAPGASVASPAAAGRAQQKPNTQPLAWSPWSRGPAGELSEIEMELFTSDRCWCRGGSGVDDVWIVLKGRNPNPGSLEWLSPNTAVFSRVGAKNEERKAKDETSPSDIACRGALQDRIKADALPAQSWRSGREGDASQHSGVKAAGNDSSDDCGYRVGEIVRVTRRVETFRGVIPDATEGRLTGVWRDCCGQWFVGVGDITTGEVLISGLSLDGIRKV